ncbi:MAG: hypothetical protein Q4G48_08865 [Bacteroidia bacterium]|nr:hypothetical protein [Bacteroidia bacterium]
MKKILFVFCAALIALASCNTVKKADNSLLKNSWTNLHEENQDGVMVFRPTHSQEFAPSMYRLVLDLKDNNVAEYLVLSPVDAHYMESGKWRFDSNTQQLTITDKDDKTVHAYQVLEVTKDLLRVKEVAKQ